MSWLIVVVLVTVCSPFLVSFLKRRYRVRKLINKIPGPDGQLIFGSALELLNVPRDKKIENFEKYMKKYGYFFRMWIWIKPLVVIANAEDLEILLESRVNIDKSFGYEFFKPWIGTGLLTSTGRRWFEKRKLLTPAFHFTTLNLFFNTIIKNCNIFLEKLKAEEGTQEFDVYSYVNNCTLDIICETAMGVTVNAQEGGSEYINSIKIMSEIIVKRIFSPWLWWNFTFSFSHLHKKQEEALRILHDFTDEVINRRKAERKMEKESGPNVWHSDPFEKQKSKAFLDLLLDISEQDGVKLTNADIREEVDTFMFEGHDTVSSAVSWAIYLLGSFPTVQEKIFEELYSIFGSSERQPTMNDITKLKYLECVMKESLRFYPTAFSIARNLSEDVKFTNYEVPAGTVTEINIYLLHRNPKYYKNPDKFNPENFSAEVSSKRHPFAFIPFSAGSRNCIGQKFAFLEEKVLLSSLLRRYKVESQQKFEEISKETELILRPGNGIKMKISKRDYSA